MLKIAVAWALGATLSFLGPVGFVDAPLTHQAGWPICCARHQDQLYRARPHDLALDSAELIDGLSITRQNWRREGAFLIAELTFANKKQFPVNGVIVTCDFFDPPDLYVGSRGSLIVRVLPPGETTIGGIEFTMLKHNVLDRDMFGAACDVVSGASAS
jgi:hypothetical protein